MATEFTCFSFLPAELRIIIWKLCLPTRVTEIDAWTFNSLHCAPWKSQNTFMLNSMPPVIMSVCREARQVALKEGCYLCFRNKDSKNNAILTNACRPPCAWVTPATGILCLDFAIRYKHDVKMLVSFHDDLVKKFRAASISVWFIGKWDGVSDFLSMLSWNLPDELETRKEWLVNMMSIVIKVPKVLAIELGLFGMNADEPIKLVDASDHEAIEKYYRLSLKVLAAGEKPRWYFYVILEQTKRLQRWSEDVKNWWVAAKFLKDRELNKDVPDDLWEGLGKKPDMGTVRRVDFRHHPVNHKLPWVKEKLESMPILRPTIMFRLCLLDCAQEG
ncbi:hypothetical protein PHISCL_06030 [Aspergillus sclerotialis]|uniref:2EXR domain-containing protein n=1 Tax=Aspergillus sclerotialis TaxID=2070753 RepID=A0A3A2ZQN9_9EURO|nr:hypothetical protein PHISCL_06030 [Aspergillus sclerotialis]